MSELDHFMKIAIVSKQFNSGFKQKRSIVVYLLRAMVMVTFREFRLKNVFM